MSNQNKLPINTENVEDMTFELPRPQPIRGFPELHWAGKRPFTSTHYFPAQKKESYGDPLDGWMNRIYWGDNLQVMSHLLKEFRGKVDLVYIDPPFDSKAEYKKTITLKGKSANSDHSTFEEKQYGDIWTNDEYLQFLYERFILVKELIADNGSLFVHCDYNKNYLIRSILNEVFGLNNFNNEIIWKRKQATSYAGNQLGVSTDTIFWYTKNKNFIYNKLYITDENITKKYIDERYKYVDENGRRYKLGDLGNPELRPNLIYDYKGCKPPANGWAVSLEKMKIMDEEGRLEFPKKENGRLMRRQFLDEYKGQIVQNLWLDIPIVNSQAKERLDYPTQKPEKLLERIIQTSTNPGSLVLDCFMGSGTTQAVAMKLGRRFIGADINMGAIQTTTKRLNSIISEKKQNRQTLVEGDPLYLNFDVYNVNNYDVFRNPAQAKDLLIQALEIEKMDSTEVFDGMKYGYKVKIMPVNRISTRKDLNPIITGMNYRKLEAQYEKTPNAVLDKIMLVCMGHQPDLAAVLKMEIGAKYNLDIKIVDILREKERGLTFKYDSEAEIAIEGDELVIKEFFPRNLLQKLSIFEENVEEWRELAESVAIDWNYTGDVLRPAVFDCPSRNELVKGKYKLPPDYGSIRVKITDLLSESLEATIEVQE